MDIPGTSAASILSRPRDRHIVAALAAVVVSMSVHFAVVRYFPSLPVGRLAEVGHQTRLPPVRLHEVRKDWKPDMQRPVRFRPENPEEVADTASADLSVLLGVSKAGKPAPPDFSDEPLAGESAPVLRKQAPADRESWEPGEEILRVEEAVYAESISALPRRYDPSAVRLANTPDVKAPVDLPVLSKMRDMAGVKAPNPGELLRNTPTAARFQSSGAADVVTGIALSEGAEFLDESADAISEFKPVEQLLNLRIRRFQPEDEDGVQYFTMEITRKSNTLLPVLKKSVLLIQDCSESMTRRKLNNCKEGLRRAIGYLNDGDFFDVMGFREDSYLCFNGWTNLTPVTRARAFGFIENMVARGQTDVYRSLQALLKEKGQGDKPVIAILVTDGRPTAGIVDSSDIINSFTRENAGVRSVFCVGGGRRVNRFLLDLLAYPNRGDSLVVRNRVEIPDAIENWAKELSRPVLADLDYRFSQVGDSEIYPRTLTHLYLDRPLILFGRCPDNVKRAAVQIIGKSSSGLHDMVFELNFEDAEEGDPDIRIQWVWHRIYELIGEHIRTGNEAVMTQIRDLADEYDLPVPYGGDIPLP